MRDLADLQAVDAGHDAVVFEVEARAERPACAGQHDDAHSVVVADRFERVVQLDDEIDRHRVEALRAVERHQRDMLNRPVDEDECFHAARLERVLVA